MPRKLTKLEQAIMRWNDSADNGDTEDLIHRHFEKRAASFREWPNVGDEGRRILSMMVQVDTERGSPIDCVLSGVAGAAYYLAINHVAKKLGVRSSSVHDALESASDGNAESFVSHCIARSVVPIATHLSYSRPRCCW